MRRQLLYARRDGPGHEHVRVSSNADRGGGTRVQSTVVTEREGAPLTVTYELRVDSAWRTRSLTVECRGAESGPVSLTAAEPGAWTVETGSVAAGDADDGGAAALDGCLDVDVAVTPFTNTLPVRRLDLAVGEAAVVDVVYVSVPDGSLSRARQRYTRRPGDCSGPSYRYESLTTGYETELALDHEGFVRVYPGLYDLERKQGAD